jgi:hypothetical protein
MRIRLLLFIVPFFALAATAASAAGPTDPRIDAMVNAVSAAELRSIDTTLVGFGTRNDFSETLNSKTRGVFAARDWIRAQFERAALASNGRMTVALDTYVQPKTSFTPRAVTESSVIATLRGGEPGPVYVMSSHYDDCNGDCTNGAGNAPGADDNGSGTSAVIEAARVMAGMPPFRGTIIFATFDGEELGLWGAHHFAGELKAQGANVVADLNNDVVGTPNTSGPDRDVIRLFSPALPAGATPALVNLYGTENSSPSRELARFVGEVVPQYVPGTTMRQIYRADRFGRGGDQEEFQAVNYPAVRFVEAHEDFYHQHKNVRVENGVQYGDLLKYIDFDYLARVAQANVAALSALALGPEMPQDVEMPYHGLGYQHLGNDSTLTWQRAPGAATYEVLWRDTSSPVWQHVQNVGDVTQVTLPVSHDDSILAVRSVGRDGLFSVAAYPKPVRLRP